MDKCPFCGSKQVKKIGEYELLNCHNIFMEGKLIDKRHITCYETELTAKNALLEDCRVYIEIAVKTYPESGLSSVLEWYRRRCDALDRLKTLLSQLEEAVKEKAK